MFRDVEGAIPYEYFVLFFNHTTALNLFFSSFSDSGVYQE